MQEKERALNNAVASVEMEGYRVSEYEKKLCMDVLNGKLTKDAFIQKLLERCNV
ncbi:MAG: antitoxin VbhA family protein [Candidatus Ornithomonoglobus sp.]